MSRAYKTRKKALKRSETVEERLLRNRIRKGELPAFHFAKDPKNINKLETEMVWTGRWTFEQQPDKTMKRIKVMAPKRTWRMISTFAAFRPDKT